jgi:hypothetical protein
MMSWVRALMAALLSDTPKVISMGVYIGQSTKQMVGFCSTCAQYLAELTHLVMG